MPRERAPRADGQPHTTPDMGPDELAARLRSLATLARSGQLPSREEFVAVVLDVAADSMQAVRTYVTKGGEAREYSEPQRQHTVRAIEVAAHIAIEAKTADIDPLSDPSNQGARERLRALGYEIVKVSGAPSA